MTGGTYAGLQQGVTGLCLAVPGRVKQGRGAFDSQLMGPGTLAGWCEACSVVLHGQVLEGLI